MNSENMGLTMKKLEIVYYSWSNGNTERIAKTLQEIAGGDLEKIDTAVPYTGSCDAAVEQGREEVRRGYEPELKPFSMNLEQYDVIAAGTPTWWYTMAPAVRTFLHSQNWNGKTVIPFMINGGWPGYVIRDMKAACAATACEMQVAFDSEGGSHLEIPEEEIYAWAQRVQALFAEKECVS